MCFYLIQAYPRSRKYRFSAMKKRLMPSDKKLWNHPLLNQRHKVTNKTRDTYLRHNARVRKHNRSVICYYE